MKLTTVLFISSLLFLTACSYLGASNPSLPGGLRLNDEKVQAFPINFATVFTMVIQPKCLSCHETFLTEERILSIKGGIEWSVFVGKTMPKQPVPKLTSCEQAILRSYLDIAAGTQAPLTVSDLRACNTAPPQPSPSPSPAPTATPDAPEEAPLTLDFKTVTSLVLEPKCMRCHSEDGFLLSASAIRDKTPDLIFEVFTEKTMPPKRVPPDRQLDACQLEILRAYLDNGAPEESSQRISDLPACQAQ